MPHNSASSSSTSPFTPVSAKALANLILDWADVEEVLISPMKLQKLVYFCHADFLVIKGLPLIAQEFEAWEYGPVIPSLFNEFKRFGATPVTSRAMYFDPVSCQILQAAIPDIGDGINQVRNSFDAYSRYTASGLSKLSHSEAGPWAEALRRFSHGTIRGRTIDNNLIAACHRHPGTDSVH